MIRLNIAASSVALLFAAVGHAMADPNGATSRRALLPVNVTSDSDASLLAERHLALYRASQRQLLLPEADGGEGIAPPMRTSATAALPLAPRSPALPDSNTQ